MRYTDDGTEIRLGDRVRLYGVQTGVVVFSIDTDEYSDEFPKGDWAYLKSGVMVKTENGALIHEGDNERDKDINKIVRIP